MINRNSIKSFIGNMGSKLIRKGVELIKSWAPLFLVAVACSTCIIVVCHTVPIIFWAYVGALIDTTKALWEIMCSTELLQFFSGKKEVLFQISVIIFLGLVIHPKQEKARAWAAGLMHRQKSAKPEVNVST